MYLINLSSINFRVSFLSCCLVKQEMKAAQQTCVYRRYYSYGQGKDGNFLNNTFKCAILLNYMYLTTLIRFMNIPLRWKDLIPNLSVSHGAINGTRFQKSNQE